MTRNKKIRDMTLIAMGAVIIVICSFITIPAAIPFTLQSFGIFFVLYNLGGKRGTLSILVYIALGICGVPVFSNFGVGIGTLLGPTGGYLFGFLGAGGLYWLAETLFGKKFTVRLFSLWVGMLLYYVCGTAGYMLWCSAKGNALSFWSAVMICVVPYVFWDIIKLSVVLLRKISYFEKYND